MGYTKSDVYLIDIDGNGNFSLSSNFQLNFTRNLKFTGIYPPAHVKCDFQSLENATKTIVELNLPSQVDVRKNSFEDFSYEIIYREFTHEMLQELISHSLYCTQSIRYECFKAPLDLHSATWFQSSYQNTTVDAIGNVKRYLLYFIYLEHELSDFLFITIVLITVISSNYLFNLCLETI